MTKGKLINHLKVKDIKDFLVMLLGGKTSAVSWPLVSRGKIVDKIILKGQAQLSLDYKGLCNKHLSCNLVKVYVTSRNLDYTKLYK